MGLEVFGVKLVEQIGQFTGAELAAFAGVEAVLDADEDFAVAGLEDPQIAQEDAGALRGDVDVGKIDNRVVFHGISPF
jgi:hypothetical protein